MRFSLSLLVLLAPVAALAGTGYTPKFAREEQQGLILVSTCTKPAYPKSSLRNDERGTVTIRFTVGPNGRVLKHQILRSSGFPDLDRASEDAFAKCSFRPASINGKPVQFPVEVQYVW